MNSPGGFALSKSVKGEMRDRKGNLIFVYMKDDVNPYRIIDISSKVVLYAGKKERTVELLWEEEKKFPKYKSSKLSPVDDNMAFQIALNTTTTSMM